MSSIADAAYLGNSYGQTYNSAGQFYVLTTTLLEKGLLNGISIADGILRRLIVACKVLLLCANPFWLQQAYFSVEKSVSITSSPVAPSPPSGD